MMAATDLVAAVSPSNFVVKQIILFYSWLLKVKMDHIHGLVKYQIQMGTFAIFQQKTSSFHSIWLLCHTIVL